MGIAGLLGSRKSGAGRSHEGDHSYNLRARFFIGVAVILLLFCSICAYIVYRQGVLLVEQAALAKSQIVMAAVEATHAFVREVLRPKVSDILGKEAFVLEAMSTSFVSRAVMERFNASMPEYRYRRVSMNARNPASEANPVEVGMIRYFSANPDKRDWHGTMQMGNESHYMRFRPVYFGPSCMRCHGAVEDAPRDMVQTYGAERGFGQKEGDIAGVIAVGIPVDVALGQLKGKAVSVFMSSLFIGGILFVFIGSLFNRVVASDLRKILKIFREELPEDDRGEISETGGTEMGLGEIPGSLQWADELKFFKNVRGHDETDEIKRAARATAERLRENRRKLEENAQNLERLVENLLRSKELLQSVFDSIPDVVILLDTDFRIKMVNKAHLKRYESSEDEVLGRYCYELHSGDICPLPDCGMQKALQSKKSVVEEIQGGGGEIFLIHFYPILNHKGEVVSVVRYARDITEQKRVEQNIQKTEKLVSLGQLAAGLAHEINNPLGVILTYADLMKPQLDGLPEAQEDIGIIEKHATTCKRIVSDLLRFARGESARKQLASLNSNIEEAIQMVAHAFSSKNISVSLELDPDLPLLNLDVDKLKQVFVNLLMNSQQAIDEKGEIRIRTSFSEETGQAEIKVWDSGRGIAPDLLQRVFDPFFSTKGAGEGTGLGLSVSYGIIRDHGGEILAHSELGQWTQFTILLPVDSA